MEKLIDLHVHTNHSDGTLSPMQVVELAARKHLKAIAITDHDAVSGYMEYEGYKKDFGVEVVPGIEIGIKNEAGRSLEEVHILGYFIDYEDGRLLDVIDALNDAKEKWLNDQVKVLNEHGLKISVEEVKAVAGTATARRPHVWKVLSKNNPDKIAVEEFFKKTSFGGDLHVKKSFDITLEDCIKLIKQTKGIPVLAHPGFYKMAKVIRLAVDAGIEGIEVKYRYSKFGKDKSEAIVRKLDGMADKYGLLKTGGSDFHGDNENGAMLGSVDVPYNYLESLKKR